MVIVVQFLQVVVPGLRGEESRSRVDIEPTTVQETDDDFDDTTRSGEATDGGQ